MRMIDADALVDKLEQIISDYTSHGMYPSDFDIRYAIDMVEDTPTLTPQNEWVSVEERLPENSAEVLMWREKWKIAEAGTYRNACFLVYDALGDSYKADDITYWMPLPAPPKKEHDHE